MKMTVSPSILFLAVFLIAESQALEIVIRYDLDSTGFFDQAGAKEALEAAAGFYEELIVDELEAIDPTNFTPGTPRNWFPTYLEPGDPNPRRITSASNLVVPANTIVIFAGARNLSSTAQGGPGGVEPLPPGSIGWFNQLFNRGEEGAIRVNNNGSFSSNPTDFAPWGGTIFFNEGLSWNFSTTDATGPGIDFLPAALHEIGHVLGLGNFGSVASSWIPFVSGSSFQGPLSTASNGNVAPSLSGGIHWANTVPESTTLAAFNREHGLSQDSLMKPLVGSTAANIFFVATDLDVAALQDIGWELRPAPENFSIKVDFDPAAPGIEIPTTTGVNYQVLRANSLESLAPSGPALAGDGSVKIWTDPNGAAAAAFYQVEASPAPSGAKRVENNEKKEKSVTVSPDPSELPVLPPFQCECHLH